MKVYYFKAWAPSVGDIVVSKRAATLDAIAKMPRAQPLMDTGFEIDESELDGDFSFRRLHRIQQHAISPVPLPSYQAAQP